jgi:hypothetical protein
MGALGGGTGLGINSQASLWSFVMDDPEF